MRPGIAACGMFAVLVCLMLAGCFQSYDRLRDQYREFRGRDSITVVYYGEEVSGGMWYMQHGIGFGDVLGPRLGEFLGTRVIWLDSSGYEITFREGTNRIQEDVVSYLPDAVIIRFGMADAIISGLTEDNFRDEVGSLFDEFDKYDIIPVVLTTYGVRDLDPKLDPLYKRLKSFNEIILWVSGEHRFPLIDVGTQMNTLLLSDPDRYRSFFTDQSHLNEDGMNFIADYIMKEIRKAVGDMSAE